jgi:sigma-E factor negative regulatory protein RseA
MNQADMNHDVRENLSAGIDGELSGEQLRFLLRRVDHDQPLQEAWARYHVARDGLRRELPALASADFSSRVMLAIAQESVHAGTARKQHWLRWSAGGAIAASVAAVALMVARPAVDLNPAGALASSGATTPSQPVLASVSSHAASNVQPTSSKAVVPPWLSGSSAGLLSQQASATVGAPFDMSQPATSGALRSNGYAPLYRYRTLDNKDGSYLLLMDSQQSARATRASGKVSATGQ